MAENKLPTEKEILDFLNSFESKAAVTHIIADKFKISNRQVGGLLGAMKRKGLIYTYTKGTVTLPGGLHCKSGAPMRLSNSYYEVTSDNIN